MTQTEKDKKRYPPSRIGIKQPRRKEVTGTIVMLDDPDDDGADSIAMKRSATGVILNPQPHDSPNDPLNWPLLKRDLCLFSVGFASFLGGGQSPLLAAGMNALSVEFDKPLTTIAYLVGGFMLALGCGSVIASPIAVMYGKRLVYIIFTLIFFGGAIWGGASTSFGSLIGARIMTGIGAAPTECLPSSTIAEIYFAHERAYRVGIYTMLMLGGKNIVPLISGLVFQWLDRHWVFWILSICLGLTVVLLFFFVPETFWDRTPTPSKRSLEETEAAKNVASYHPPEQRPNAYALRRPSQMNLGPVYSLSSSVNDEDVEQAHKPVGVTEDVLPETGVVEEKKKSYWKDLTIYQGRFTQDKWWMITLRPFFLYSYPAILFGSLTYSLAVVWLIVISETIGEIFRSPPYGYSQLTVGLFYVSPFVGGILGSLSCGLVSDRISRFIVSKNHGVYEPEFRLVMIIPSTFFIVFGLMGFGWSAQVKDPWIGPIIFFGSLSFGSSMASTTAITFAVDSYKVFAGELLVSFNFLKNFLGFCFSLFNNSYIHDEGHRTSFITYGCIQLFVSLFGIPLYIYGKRLRSWTDEKEIMRCLYIEENRPPSMASRKLDTDGDLHDGVTM